MRKLGTTFYSDRASNTLEYGFDIDDLETFGCTLR